ncbi:hypothetical protein MC7420_751 [Coleofasciculus chthonoplastes PCC 7420]|uniref:Uncharacterized protein n=1 Tax=Coleofasciculus chthonoplastes PCC 7420 TaxID=118168 RepID=B4VT16_9CYAN|nr:hypothetical protein MC7420_751 [Coleofasciculus chthonoplastes PCC 7420]
MGNRKWAMGNGQWAMGNGRPDLIEGLVLEIRASGSPLQFPNDK